MPSIKAVLQCLFLSSIIYVQDSYSQELKKAPEKKETVLYIRKNAASPEALPDLKAMEKAIRIMRSLPCESALSWYYQGAIHAVPDSIPNGNPLCPRFITVKDTLTGWDCCPHTNIHFLTWHRLFLWHFEKIVRKFSGKKDFALPYWDYTNPKNRILPAIFRDSNSSLFEPARRADLNQGKPMGKCLDLWLTATHADSSRLYNMFNNLLSYVPHSIIHPVVGGWYCTQDSSKLLWNKVYQRDTVGLMWDFQTAAFDPIFWLHHANVDFLWQRWEVSRNGSLPILDSLKAIPWRYIFFDENDEHKIVYSMEEVLYRINSMDYNYDVLRNKIRKVPTRTANPAVLLGQTQIGKIVSSSNLSFTVRFPAQPIKMTRLPLEKNLFLLDITVSYSNQTLGIYELYLESSSGSRLIGHFTFVGKHRHELKATDNHMAHMDGTTRSRKGKAF